MTLKSLESLSLMQSSCLERRVSTKCYVSSLWTISSSSSHCLWMTSNPFPRSPWKSLESVPEQPSSPSCLERRVSTLSYAPTPGHRSRTCSVLSTGDVLGSAALAAAALLPDVAAAAALATKEVAVYRVMMSSNALLTYCPPQRHLADSRSVKRQRTN